MGKVKAKRSKPAPQYHACVQCGRRCKVEFKRCAICNGVAGRNKRRAVKGTDAMDHRVPGSHGRQ